MTTSTPLRGRTDRRRGLLLAVALHGSFVALCVYPFLSRPATDDAPYETVVELDFRRSSAAANADARERNATERALAEREAAPRNPAPPALPPKPSPPILSAPTPLPPVPDVPEVEAPTPEPEPTIAPSPAPPVEVAAAPPGPPASAVDGAGAANADGDATGAPERGDGSTVSDIGEAASPVGSAFGGDGVITRAVVYRPSIDELIVENGVVVLDVCINQRGRVTKVRWNEDASTLTDLDLVRKAQAKAKAYVFETDRSAPRLECGRLSIRVKGL